MRWRFSGPTDNIRAGSHLGGWPRSRHSLQSRSLTDTLEFMSDVTRLLDAAAAGASMPASESLPLVYDERRKLAAVRLADEKLGQTLQPTALVHEAYVRLVGSDEGRRWDGRGHFFAAAESMRRILVEAVRRKGSAKHGGRARRELDDGNAVIGPGDPDQLLALDEAPAKLATSEPELAKLVELRFFTGLGAEEAAKALGVSPRTVKRDWSYP
jgi:RNA polymerase sigma factor (TIGR02999 family)